MHTTEWNSKCFAILVFFQHAHANTHTDNAKAAAEFWIRTRHDRPYCTLCVPHLYVCCFACRFFFIHWINVWPLSFSPNGWFSFQFFHGMRQAVVAADAQHSHVYSTRCNLYVCARSSVSVYELRHTPYSWNTVPTLYGTSVDSETRS